MKINNEINIIKTILTECTNKQDLNEVNLKTLSWAIPAIAGGLYTGAKSTEAEYEKFKNKGTLQNTWDSIVNPTETTTNLGDALKNIGLDTAKGIGYGLGARTAVTPLGKTAIRGTTDIVGKGISKSIEATLPPLSRQAGKATGIIGQTVKAAGEELSKGLETTIPVVGRQAGKATGYAVQGAKKATQLTGQAASKTSEIIGQGAKQVAQGVKQAASVVSDIGQSVRSGGISVTPKKTPTFKLTPGSLARGLAGGIGGLATGAITSPLVRKGLETVGVENEDVKDVADTIISGGIGSGVGAAIAGGSVAGAAAAGAAVPAAAIAGWQAGRQLGNRIGAGDASKTGAYEQTKEKGWWDLAKGAFGMDDESARQSELEAEGKKAETRQKEFFEKRQKQQEIKNTFNIGGIQTGLQDFYTKNR